MRTSNTLQTVTVQQPDDDLCAQLWSVELQTLKLLYFDSDVLSLQPRDVTNFTVGGFAPMSPRISSPMHHGGGGECRKPNMISTEGESRCCGGKTKCFPGGDIVKKLKENKNGGFVWALLASAACWCRLKAAVSNPVSLEPLKTTSTGS